jgi:hypothetical protein
MGTLRKENNGFMASNSNIGQPCYIDPKWWQIVAFFFPFPPSNLPKSLVQQWKYNFVENKLPYSWHGCFSCSHKTPFPFYANVAYLKLLLSFLHAFQACPI